jgi:pimeloyl-ACP methyl ester carboxylesterase
MIHGAGGGGWEYEKWKPVFEKAGFLVIAHDLVPAKGGLAKTHFKDYLAQVARWSKQAKRPLVLAGASMGGILALKSAERLKPDAIVLINAATPKSVPRKRSGKPAPSVIRWANGPLKDTRDAMPDSDEATILAAHKRWRDESGSVVNAIRTGIEAKKPLCPSLVVVGEKDMDIPPETSRRLAKWLGADVKAYEGMSHVGPLLSTRAEEVARDVISWLNRAINVIPPGA